MNTQNLKLIFSVLLSLSIAVLSGCERIPDAGMTEDMIAPPDTEMMPILKVGANSPSAKCTLPLVTVPNLPKLKSTQTGGILGMQVEFVYKEEVTEDRRSGCRNGIG